MPLEALLTNLKNKSTTIVDLQNFPLSQVQLAQILVAINTCGQINEINLSKCNIRDNGAELIASFLRGNSTVTKLILTHNNITTRGFASLADAFIHPNVFHRSRTQQALIREMSDIAFDYDDLINRHDIAMGENFALTTLDVTNNQITDISLSRVRHIALGSHLNQLNLLNNPLNNDTKAWLESVRVYGNIFDTERETPEIRTYISQRNRR